MAIIKNILKNIFCIYVKYIEILTVQAEGATENIGERLHYLEIYSM